MSTGAPVRKLLKAMVNQAKQASKAGLTGELSMAARGTYEIDSEGELSITGKVSAPVITTGAGNVGADVGGGWARNRELLESGEILVEVHLRL